MSATSHASTQTPPEKCFPVKPGTCLSGTVSIPYVEVYLSSFPKKKEAVVVIRYALALAALLIFTSNSLTGVWTGEMKDTEGGSGGAYLQLTQDGTHISGLTGASKDHS